MIINAGRRDAPGRKHRYFRMICRHGGFGMGPQEQSAFRIETAAGQPDFRPAARRKQFRNDIAERERIGDDHLSGIPEKHPEMGGRGSAVDEEGPDILEVFVDVPGQITFFRRIPSVPQRERGHIVFLILPPADSPAEPSDSAQCGYFGKIPADGCRTGMK